MDIEATSFPQHLLDLFINISEAEFVSFDLELSGIPSRLPGKERWRPKGCGRNTLEHRYAETKAAADKYRILQVGITCAYFDYIANHYVLRPYNITLSPLLEERLDIEREVCFQTGAASFLLANGFDMGAPFARGVQYLSREEAQQAKQMAYDRLDKKNAVEDLQLKEEDVESLDFVQRARVAIVEWKATRDEMLVITTHTGLPKQPPNPVISRFEKRLVHQLVRAEFRDLVSIGRNDCIRIIRHDPQREAENIKRNKQRIKESIAKQTGFRWIFEALAKGDIHEADPFHFPYSVSKSIIGADCHDIKDRFDRAHERLKKHQPVLVGHNMFTDIVYFYRTFVGELPETLGEFCEAIHRLFPRMVDTKYLATFTEGDLNASPSLQEIAEKIEDQALPRIVTHSAHTKYDDVQAFHEAGFDSLLTGTVLLRLSAKLNAERQEGESVDNQSKTSFKTAAEDFDMPVNNLNKIEEAVNHPAVDRCLQLSAEPSHQKQRGPKVKRKDETSTSSAHRFQTQNLFENLRGLTPNSESETDSTTLSKEEAVEGVAAVNAASGDRWQDEQYSPNTTGWTPIDKVQREPMELIPTFDADFWDVFGNTLRVYGTQEWVLKIAEWD